MLKFELPYYSMVLNFIKRYFIVFVLFLSNSVISQDFDFTITKTDETCSGNATILFEVINNDLSASVEYALYKYPDLNNTIAVVYTNSAGSLNSGDYKVIASQVFSDHTVIVEHDITIQNLIEPLTYTVSSTNQNCAQQGSITITTNSGHPVTYEIFDGPVTRPLQSENIFDSLPEGTYAIRVFDICGEGIVTTYSLFLNSNELSISDTSYPAELISCDFITVENVLSASSGSIISYPLSVQYTVIPPGNLPEYIINKTIQSGDQFSTLIGQQFPIMEANYTYNIQITDNCGNIFTKEGLIVNSFPIVDSLLVPVPCSDNYVQVNVTNFMPPFTVDFIEAPVANFNPSFYNSQHPGPFTEDNVKYGDEPGNVMPNGEYVIEITDACGRKATTTIIIETILPEPVVSGTNGGCFSDFGNITASIPGRVIVNATVSQITPAITSPQDVSSSIDEGVLNLVNMPVGSYHLVLIDECGKIYGADVIIPEFTDRGITINSRPDCVINFASVEIKSNNGKIVNVLIIEAPETFIQLFNDNFPYNISSNLTSSGVLYMNGLPDGNYIFETTDVCGITTTTSVTLSGYNPLHDSYSYIKNCGSFDIVMYDEENQLSAQLYWLQKYYPGTSQWGHPDTGVLFTDNSLPSAENAINLINNQTLHNLTGIGEFRILKTYQSYGNAAKNKNCLEVLGAFEFTDGLIIKNAYKAACLGVPDGVYIQAEGVAPYNFKIVEKDNEPFLFDNGDNNIFTGLEPGVYKFMVEDACGSRKPLIANINTLPSIAEAYQAPDLIECIDGTFNTGYNFNLSTQDSAVLGPQNAQMYTVTYYLTYADAEVASNPLNTDFVNTSGTQTIYARVEHNSITLCHDISSFEIITSQKPIVNVQEKVYICDGGTVTIMAQGSGVTDYTWSTGETGSMITVIEPGEYYVIASNDYCESDPVYVMVEHSVKPRIISIDTQDWTDDKNSVIVNTSDNSEFQYSIDREVWQDSNVFEGLKTGVYTVYVKDKNGCGIVQQEVVLLNYPKFFTPNGDYSHDKWRIKYSANEPHLTVEIFDRYGKLITVLDAMDEGWDGTLNGAKLPSTDYWFVATREDGRIFKGHFAMKR